MLFDIPTTGSFLFSFCRGKRGQYLFRNSLSMRLIVHPVSKHTRTGSLAGLLSLAYASANFDSLNAHPGGVAATGAVDFTMVGMVGSVRSCRGARGWAVARCRCISLRDRNCIRQTEQVESLDVILALTSVSPPTSVCLILALAFKPRLSLVSPETECNFS